MAHGGIRYLEQLLRQAGREIDPDKLNRITAEIFRIVAEREKVRKPTPTHRRRHRAKGR